MVMWRKIVVSLRPLASFNMSAAPLGLIKRVPSSVGLDGVNALVAKPPIAAPPPSKAARRVNIFNVAKEIS